MKKFYVLLVAALLVAASAPAYAYQPPEGGVFNVPRPWGSQAERYHIVSTVDKAINKTSPTEADPQPTILISTYLLDSGKSVDALIAACKRGVSVRVIMDHDIDNKQSKRLIKALNSDNVTDDDGNGVPDDPPKAGPCDTRLRGQSTRTDDRPLTDARARAMVAAPTDESITWGSDHSYAKKCDGSCRGGGGNMHSKFYVFSHTGKADNVVMVSSSNLNRGGALLGWNDMYVMKSVPKLYDEFKKIHREMTEDTKAGDGLEEASEGPFTARFFPMKNAHKSNDPTLKDLDKIRCRSAFGRTRINVSMFYWKGTRGDYLASKLLNLARAGCSVSIVYGAPSVAIATRLRAAAKRHAIQLYDSRWDFNHDGYNEIRTHAKYVLVRGTFGGDSSAYEVMTGSQNWVAGSLSKGDEVSLNISLRSAYRSYLADWTRIRKHARKLPYH